MSVITFNGSTSTAKNVTVLEYPAPRKPAISTKTVKIPGRNGEVTLAETESYEPYMMECVCMVADVAKVATAAAWLTGSGDLILGNDTTYAYEAKIIEEIEFKKIMRGHDNRKFTVPFLVQPLKKLASTESDIQLTASGNVTNVGHVTSRPKITVVGSGDITLSVGSYIIELDDVDTSIVIDSDLGMAFDATLAENLSSQCSGDWPLLAVGVNAVSWTGTVTSVTFTPRWRYL